jgi:CspA family cold shock protein
LASLQINNAAISSIAERIVQARRLHGPDSAYTIGLFASLEWLLDGSGGDATRRQIQDRVLELEGGKPAPATAPPPARPAPAPETGSGRGKGEGLEENTWIRGAVKWFNNDKGYGFISTAADTDVFVHWRDISSWDRSLTQGDEVEFMVTKTAKGFQAINVMKPGAATGETDEATATATATAADGQDVDDATEQSEAPPSTPEEAPVASEPAAVAEVAEPPAAAEPEAAPVAAAPEAESVSDAPSEPDDEAPPPPASAS